MSHAFLGQTCALLAAVTWAMAVVLFKKSGESIAPLPLNLYKNTVGIVLIAATLAIAGEGLSTVAHFRGTEVAILIVSGVIGIALADTLVFRGLNLIGVGILSIVDCSYSPFVIFFSVLMLAEELTVWHYAGAALIVTAVYISSGHTPPANRTRRQITFGIFLTLTAMATMTFSIVLIKPILDVQGFPLLWATIIRLFFGSVALALIALASPKRRDYWSVFRPSRVWVYALPAAVLGAYLSIVFWMAGFKYARASVAAILNQTSVLFAIVLAAVFLHEPLTRRKWVALALAFAGVLVTLKSP